MVIFLLATELFSQSVLFVENRLYILPENCFLFLEDPILVGLICMVLTTAYLVRNCGFWLIWAAEDI